MKLIFEGASQFKQEKPPQDKFSGSSPTLLCTRALKNNLKAWYHPFLHGSFQPFGWAASLFKWVMSFFVWWQKGSNGWSIARVSARGIGCWDKLDQSRKTWVSLDWCGGKQEALLGVLLASLSSWVQHFPDVWLTHFWSLCCSSLETLRGRVLI